VTHSSPEVLFQDAMKFVDDDDDDDDDDDFKQLLITGRDGTETG